MSLTVNLIGKEKEFTCLFETCIVTLHEELKNLDVEVDVDKHSTGFGGETKNRYGLHIQLEIPTPEHTIKPAIVALAHAIVEKAGRHIVFYKLKPLEKLPLERAHIRNCIEGAGSLSDVFSLKDQKVERYFYVMFRAKT